MGVVYTVPELIALSRAQGHSEGMHREILASVLEARGLASGLAVLSVA
jgi:hypothetical protein